MGLQPSSPSKDMFPRPVWGQVGEDWGDDNMKACHLQMDFPLRQDAPHIKHRTERPLNPG